jgi:putative ABC transport system permease protein
LAADVALSSQLPLSGDFDAYGVAFESAPQTAQDEMGVLRYAVTPEWFATMGIPLRAGRLLDARDRPGSPGAVVISESLARRYFGEQDPIGQRVRFGPEIVADLSWNVIVGVVADVRQSSLAFTPSGAFYVAMGQWVWVDQVQSLVVRTRGDAAALVPSVKQAIWSVDRTPPVVRVATMEDLVAASEPQRRFVLTVLGVFALSALAIAAVGLYGVIAGSVAERTREIGLRGALGASRRRILGLVARQGATLTAFGVAIGLAAAAAVTRGLTSLLFGVTSLDPVTYAGVTVLLAGVAAAACSVPAWRAASVDPAIALRTE